jgi:hypothetical protein
MVTTITSNNSTSLEWINYFGYNRENLLPIPWDSSYQLTDIERATISHSISCFQLGESSEGNHLMQAARIYGDRTQDKLFVDAVKLFIGEEQRHARTLGQFMKQQAIPLAKHHWTDTIFRKLRRLLNLEISLAVLLTAELIATVYYKALGDATKSPTLNQLCQQILHDEKQHVYFQTLILHQICHNRPDWLLKCIQLLQKLLFGCTLMIVWLDHGKVFLKSGYTFKIFSDDCWLAFNRAIQIIYPNVLLKTKLNE